MWCVIKYFIRRWIKIVHIVVVISDCRSLFHTFFTRAFSLLSMRLLNIRDVMYETLKRWWNIKFSMETWMLLFSHTREMLRRRAELKETLFHSRKIRFQWMRRILWKSERLVVVTRKKYKKNRMKWRWEGRDILINFHFLPYCVCRNLWKSLACDSVTRSTPPSKSW